METNGLLHDYIEMGKISDKILSNKLSDILKRLDHRTDMMVEMAHHLNSFGHRFDSPSAAIDLNELMLEHLFFIHRTAKLKKINIIKDIQEGEIYINSHPSLLQFVIHQFFDKAFDLLKENDELKLSTDQHREKAHVTLSLKSVSPPLLPIHSALAAPVLQLCLKKLDSHLEIDTCNTDSTTITLSLPRSK